MIPMRQSQIFVPDHWHMIDPFCLMKWLSES